MTPTFRLWIGAFLLSLAPVFVKTLPALGPTNIGFYRCALAALILFPFSWTKGGTWKPGSQKTFLWLVLLGGFVFGIDLFIWHRSVLYCGAGMGTILANSQVFYLGVAGLFFLGEKPTLRFLVAVLMSAMGTFLLVYRMSGVPTPETYYLGVYFGLGTGLVYASYVLTLRAIEKLETPTTLPFRLMMVSAASSLWLFLFSMLDGGFAVPSGMEWVWVLILAFFVQIIAWLLITGNLKSVPISRVGLLLLTQPVGAMLWGSLFFGETLTDTQWAGAGITLVALYLGVTRGKRSRTV